MPLREKLGWGTLVVVGDIYFTKIDSPSSSILRLHAPDLHFKAMEQEWRHFLLSRFRAMEPTPIIARGTWPHPLSEVSIPPWSLLAGGYTRNWNSETQNSWWWCLLSEVKEVEEEVAVDVKGHGSDVVWWGRGRSWRHHSPSPHSGCSVVGVLWWRQLEVGEAMLGGSGNWLGLIRQTYSDLAIIDA